ncbi:hypothetical protein DUI87_18900 [Hirundo rustica rustica]|uniref:Uncharacterized protein n=1 Tax=Hirundo rustica rustica TaxID=333673 RepID=A0A3M0JTT9_HIRRU|nr:hypothetical protein DUI87_18900 [Hirundo rustica rustica]
MQGTAPGEEQPQAPAQPWADLLGSSSAEKDLGVLADSELSMSQQCVLVAKKSNGILREHEEEHCQQVKGGDPVPCSVLVRPHLECCVQFWAPQEKRHGVPGLDPATKMMKGLEHLSYDKS